MKWEKVKLKNVGLIVTGNTPSKQNRNYWKKKDIPFVSPSELSNTSLVKIKKSKEYISDLALEKVRLIPKDSILVCCIGSLGKIGIADIEVVTNQQINSIICDKERVNYKYVAYAITKLKDKMNQIAASTTIKIINKTLFGEFEIPLPPIEIQIKIAEALDKAQELIDNRKLQLEKYDELIQSTFIDMFGDPVTNPKKWEVKRLKEISTKILSGNTPKGGSNVYIKKGIPFFRSQNVWRNKIKYEDIVYIDEAIHRSMQKSSLKNRDILITKTGRINTENSSLGRAAMFLGEDNKGNINGHVYLVRLKKCMVDRFVLYIITTDKYREYIRSICVGAIDKRQINKNHLEEFPIINPPIELQSKFASIVEKIENEKKLCEESLKQMEENFKTMIHKAFRGELF